MSSPGPSPAALAVVVAASAAYELRWKAKRLRADLAELDAVSASCAGVQSAADQRRPRRLSARSGAISRARRE